MCGATAKIFNKYYNTYSNWSCDQIFINGLKSDNINNAPFLFKLAMLNDVKKWSNLFYSVKTSKLFICLYLVVVEKMLVDHPWIV